MGFVLFSSGFQYLNETNGASKYFLYLKMDELNLLYTDYHIQYLFLFIVEIVHDEFNSQPLGHVSVKLPLLLLIHFSSEMHTY